MRFAVVGLNVKRLHSNYVKNWHFRKRRSTKPFSRSSANERRWGARQLFIDECVILSTCNRTEVYCVFNCDIFNPSAVGAFIAERQGVSFEEVAPHLYHFEGHDAVEHLFRVGSGLESMVLGEHQIAGQIKKAYYQAVACQSNGVFINKVFHAAFHVSKRIRSET